MRRGVELPSFFKVYLPHFSSQKMKLPLDFTLQAQGALPDKVFLRDRYGNLWPVELAKTGKNWFFQDGWVKFLEDNKVEVGDFLMFQFDGTNLFDIKLRGTSGCEKKGVGALKFTVAEEEQEKNEEKEAGQDVGVAEILCNEDNHTDDDDYEVEDDDDDDDDDDEEEGVKEEEEEGQIELQNKKEPKSKFSKGTKWTAIGRAESSHKVRDIPESYGADIFKSGLYPLPKNPYFVTKIRRERRDELYIPADVINDYNLDLPQVMTLRDPVGRTKTTHKRNWKDGRVWYTGGWRSLCRWNLVEDGDRCICEFMKGEGQKSRLFVQIRIVCAGATSR